MAALERRVGMKIDIEKLHTTELGAQRIRRNLGLETEDVVVWCKQTILSAGDQAITRQGKNWYAQCPGCVITVNAHSSTIITEHKIKAI